ncbi:Proton-coupled folate transporter, partial [Geodia barretti]
SAGALSGFLYTLAVYLEWSIYWFVPLTLIVALAGGIPGILTVVYAYVADVSSTKWLTLRLGIVESMVFFGSGTSLALGGVWLQSSHCKFVAPYAIYCIANILILVYVLFLLPESLTRSQRKAKFTGSSGLRHIARSFQIFFTRNEYSRWRLWCVVCSMFIIYLVFTGASEISTLFLLHAPLKWTPGAIGIFQAMSQLSYGLSIFLIIPLFVYLRVPDALILLIGVLWGTVCYLLTGFVRNGWEMYAVGVVQGVESIVGPPIRSTISKAVALKDQGAAFSILSSVEVLAALSAGIIFFFFLPSHPIPGAPSWHLVHPDGCD